MKTHTNWRKYYHISGWWLKKAYFSILHGFEGILGGFNPTTEEQLKNAEIEACVDFENQKACDRVIEI